MLQHKDVLPASERDLHLGQSGVIGPNPKPLTLSGLRGSATDEVYLEGRTDIVSRLPMQITGLKSPSIL